MAKQIIGLGTTADDGTGDTLRAAGAKLNLNFTELYDGAAALLKNNYAATVAPTVTNDSGSGYAVGSSWLIAGTGDQWRCRSATAGAARWTKLDTADFGSYRAGLYYSLFGLPTPAAGQSASANNVRLAYGVIKQRCTIDQLVVRITTAGTSMALAIYREAGGLPTGAPVAKTASFAVGSAATFTPSLDVASVALEPGRILHRRDGRRGSYCYWVCRSAASTVSGWDRGCGGPYADRISFTWVHLRQHVCRRVSRPNKCCAYE